MTQLLKLILMTILFIVQFDVSSNESSKPTEAMTMAKCSGMAVLLKLQDDGLIYLAAYVEIKGIDTVDDEYHDHFKYIAAFIDGYAAGINKPKDTITRDFFYKMCKGSLFDYAKDLMDTRRNRLKLN